MVVDQQVVCQIRVVEVGKDAIISDTPVTALGAVTAEEDRRQARLVGAIEDRKESHYDSDLWVTMKAASFSLLTPPLSPYRPYTLCLSHCGLN